MKKKIVLRSLIILGIAFIIYESYSIVSMIANPNLEVLENVRTIDLKNNSSIAIMVQDTNTDEWHEADSRDSWPDPSKYGFVGAECTDSEGATIDWEKVLTFSLSNQTATIKTKQTAYCTLYFAKGTPALDWLGKKGGNTFAGSAHTTITDGMYRFKGTASQVLNNYICFGTVLESECLKTPATYMYRIIGITSAADTTIGLYANQLKIIKATPSSTSQQWHSGNSSKVLWDASNIKTYLNGTTKNGNSSGFLQTIIDGTDGTYWESMISNHRWYIKDQTEIGTTEPKDANYISTESKIGLMYGSDYNNAGAGDTSNWLFITNGWTGNISGDEWTMSNYGMGSMGLGAAWAVWSKWGFLYGNPNITYAMSGIVRPTFYLRPGINLAGEGTKEHPYIITTMNNA